MLHVLNGDATRWKLERSDVPGTFAMWADALHEGPVPGEEATPEDWRQTRLRTVHSAPGPCDPAGLPAHRDSRRTAYSSSTMPLFGYTR